MNGFALWVGVGSTLGLWRVARSAPPRQAATWVNTGLFVLFTSLVGARLFYVSINWGYFSTHLIEIPQLWLGGVGWPGALTGAWLAMIYLAIVTHSKSQRKGSNQLDPKNLKTLAWLGDRLYPLLPPIAITTWLGCWQAGVAYGPLLPPGTLWGVPSLDETGLYNLHWPLQPAAACLLILFFAILETQVKPLRPVGRLSGLAMFGLLLHLLAASLLSADPAPTWRGLRIETWWAMGMLVVFIFYVFVTFLAGKIAKRRQFNFSL